MKYLKDEITGAVRKFNEEVPKQERRYAIFKKARRYGTDEKGNIEVVGRRWKDTTKTEYTKYIKASKGDLTAEVE